MTSPPSPSSGPSDEVLLAGFAASDPAATVAFVERFQRRVYGLALTVVGEPRAAEDVAQEAMVRAWRHGNAFDVRRGSVVTWLLAITRNAAIDSLRVRRPVTVDPDDLAAVLPPATDRDPADVVVLGADVDQLRVALAALPGEQQRAIVLAGIWGMTGREIAEREQIPLGTAKTRIRAGLRRVRVALAGAEHAR
jgi:RNA polymerase sigma-70 factor (ECF subfamily)